MTRIELTVALLIGCGFASGCETAVAGIPAPIEHEGDASMDDESGEPGTDGGGQEGEGDTGGADRDAPPVVERLELLSVNGDEVVDPLTEPAWVRLEIDATDDSEITRVELLDGDSVLAELLPASVGQTSFEYEFLIAGGDDENGWHEFGARVVDDQGQSASAMVLPLEVALPSSLTIEETTIWHSAMSTDDADQTGLSCTMLADGTLAVGGTMCELGEEACRAVVHILDPASFEVVERCDVTTSLAHSQAVVGVLPGRHGRSVGVLTESRSLENEAQDVRFTGFGPDGPCGAIDPEVGSWSPSLEGQGQSMRVLDARRRFDGGVLLALETWETPDGVSSEVVSIAPTGMQGQSMEVDPGRATSVRADAWGRQTVSIDGTGDGGEIHLMDQQLHTEWTVAADDRARVVGVEAMGVWILERRPELAVRLLRIGDGSVEHESVLASSGDGELELLTGEVDALGDLVLLGRAGAASPWFARYEPDEAQWSIVPEDALSGDVRAMCGDELGHAFIVGSKWVDNPWHGATRDIWVARIAP